jgi:hypothetical protein
MQDLTASHLQENALSIFNVTKLAEVDAAVMWQKMYQLCRMMSLDLANQGPPPHIRL